MKHTWKPAFHLPVPYHGFRIREIDTGLRQDGHHEDATGGGNEGYFAQRRRKRGEQFLSELQHGSEKNVMVIFGSGNG